MENKKIYASKTFWFNSVTILVVIATMFGYTPNQELAESTSTILMSVSPIINLILRFYTDKKVSL